MHPAIRTQADDLGQEYSMDTALDFSESIDMARQEFKNDADINVLLGRFGVNTPQRQTTYGEVDFGMDLQQAIGAIDAARRMHRKLPLSLRERYPTWQSVLNGLNDGTLRLDLEEESDTRTTEAPITGAPAKEGGPQ